MLMFTLIHYFVATVGWVLPPAVLKYMLLQNPSAVDNTAMAHMSEHCCNSGDQDALDVSLSTWESPAANGIGWRSIRGNSSLEGHTVPAHVGIKPFKQSEAGM